MTSCLSLSQWSPVGSWNLRLQTGLPSPLGSRPEFDPLPVSAHPSLDLKSFNEDHHCTCSDSPLLVPDPPANPRRNYSGLKSRSTSRLYNRGLPRDWVSCPEDGKGKTRATREWTARASVKRGGRPRAGHTSRVSGTL